MAKKKTKQQRRAERRKKQADTPDPFKIGVARAYTAMTLAAQALEDAHAVSNVREEYAPLARILNGLYSDLNTLGTFLPKEYKDAHDHTPPDTETMQRLLPQEAGVSNG